MNMAAPAPHHRCPPPDSPALRAQHGNQVATSTKTPPQAPGTARQRLLPALPTAADWDRHWRTGQGRLVTALEQDRFLRRVRPQPGTTALDIGCGTGKWTRNLASWGLSVTGFDFSSEALRQAQAFPHPRVEFRHWDFDDRATRLPGLPRGGLHLVTCRLSLEYLDTRQLLAHVARWLHPHGAFYALTRVADSDHAAVTAPPFTRMLRPAQLDAVLTHPLWRSAYHATVPPFTAIVLRSPCPADLPLRPR
ncbi:class I SAM-dependent methyltransferase [Streptomyces spectabilis]|uniref:class I SAM-dependent methyltransferase n=1 Tax=Streptomyces spectabilis TaxID=68270 RepID=UPI0033E9A5AB